MHEFIHRLSVPLLGSHANLILDETFPGTVRLTNDGAPEDVVTDVLIRLPVAVAGEVRVTAAAHNPVSVQVDHPLRALWRSRVPAMCGAAERGDAPTFWAELEALRDGVERDWEKNRVSPVAEALVECTPLDAALADMVARLATKEKEWSQGACRSAILHAHYGAALGTPGAEALLEALLGDPRNDVDARDLRTMIWVGGLAARRVKNEANGRWMRTKSGGFVHSAVASRLAVGVETLKATAFDCKPYKCASINTLPRT
jgi:hypothetical protein